METVKSKDGTILTLDRAGTGPAVVLICGAQTTQLANAPLAALLAQNFTVFNYDRRGRGESGDMQPYAVEREVEDLDAIIQAAGGAAGVFGISSGAILGLLAAARGLNISRLALYEPPFDVEAGPARPPADHATPIANLVDAGRRAEAVEYFMGKVVGIPPEIIRQARTAPWWAASEAIAHTLAYDMILVRDYTLYSLPLASIRIPTLVMAGAASPAFLQNAAEALVQALPNAALRILPGQSHDVSPEALAPALIEFLAKPEETRR